MSLSTLLQGRGRRREYWLGFVAVLALLLISRVVGNPFLTLPLSLAGLLVWMFVAARRLRDIGWPAGLVLAPIGLMILAVALAFTPPYAGAWLAKAVGFLMTASGWTWLAFILVIGAWKPRPADALDPERRAEVFG